MYISPDILHGFGMLFSLFEGRTAMPNNLRDDLIDILKAVSRAPTEYAAPPAPSPTGETRSEQLSPSKTYVSYRYGI